MGGTDELLARLGSFSRPDAAGLAQRPAKRLAVVACMDARLDVYQVLGLQPGDAHIVRNAGGVVTDDVIRSLAISQRQLGTTEVILVHHTDCGMQTITDDGFKQAVEDEVGLRPPWPVAAFTDLAQSLRDSIARIKSDPFLPRRDAVRGFIFDVASGELSEVN